MEMILIVLFLIISLAIFVIALYQCLKWYKKFSFKSDPEDPKDMERRALASAFTDCVYRGCVYSLYACSELYYYTKTYCGLDGSFFCF
jgi:hypothetical protein